MTLTDNQSFNSNKNTTVAFSWKTFEWLNQIGQQIDPNMAFAQTCLNVFFFLTQTWTPLNCFKIQAFDKSNSGKVRTNTNKWKSTNTNKAKLHSMRTNPTALTLDGSAIILCSKTLIDAFVYCCCCGITSKVCWLCCCCTTTFSIWLCCSWNAFCAFEAISICFFSNPCWSFFTRNSSFLSA